MIERKNLYSHSKRPRILLLATYTTTKDRGFVFICAMGLLVIRILLFMDVNVICGRCFTDSLLSKATPKNYGWPSTLSLNYVHSSCFPFFTWVFYSHPFS